MVPGKKATKPRDLSHAAAVVRKHWEVRGAGVLKRHPPGVSVTQLGKKVFAGVLK